MQTIDPGSFAIALYVPDTTALVLNSAPGFGRVILDGIPELDFLPPPWWEESHTVRLALVEAATSPLSG